jgi:hypothetical protein
MLDMTQINLRMYGFQFPSRHEHIVSSQYRLRVRQVVLKSVRRSYKGYAKVIKATIVTRER